MKKSLQRIKCRLKEGMTTETATYASIQAFTSNLPDEIQLWGMNANEYVLDIDLLEDNETPCGVIAEISYDMSNNGFNSTAKDIEKLCNPTNN